MRLERRAEREGAAGGKGQLVAIDCLRFVCALMVLAFHYFTVFPLAATSPTLWFGASEGLSGDGARWTWCGWIGVEIFFVISGYVIARSAARSGRTAFLWRRLLRLAPAAWICATVTAAVLVIGANLETGDVLVRWLQSVTFWPIGGYIDSSYWTLTVELAFYLFVSIWLRDDRDNSGRIEAIGWFLALASGAYWTLALLLHVPPGLALESPLRLLLMPHGALFALGIAIWSLGSTPVSVRKLLLCGLAGAAALVEITLHAGMLSGVGGTTANPVYPIILFLTGIAVMIFAGQLQRPLVRMVSQGRLMTMGLMTYPLYLLHQVAGAGLFVGLTKVAVPGPVAVGLTVVAVVAISWAVVAHLEPLVRHWLTLAAGARPDGDRRASPSLAPARSPK